MLVTVETRGRAGNWVVHLWDTGTGKEIRKCEVEPGSLVATSPAGRILVVGGLRHDNKTIRVLDPATGTERVFALPVDVRFSSDALSPDGRTLALGTSDGTILLWEVASGQVRRRFRGHLATVMALDFAPDGKTLASGSFDNTALLWDVIGLAGAARSRPLPLSVEEGEQCWAALAGGDAPKAHQAMLKLMSSPGQALPLLKARLKPAVPPDPQSMARLLERLDSPNFTDRQTVSAELEKLGERAEAALRAALAGKPSLEARRRLAELLDKLERTGNPESLRCRRAVEVLEHIGTAEARAVLARAAEAAPETVLGQEAKGALDRLTRRDRSRP
jgi:hypothetical protein